MREILFRGKTEKGKWVYGGIAFQEDGEVVLVGALDKYYSLYDLGLNADYVIPDTVGQFTGLTDKNGTKIFEGDIISCQRYCYPDDRENYSVVFENGKFLLCDQKQHADFEIILIENVKYFDAVVVGNIHDNPELLN